MGQIQRESPAIRPGIHGSPQQGTYLSTHWAGDFLKRMLGSDQLIPHTEGGVGKVSGDERSG